MDYPLQKYRLTKIRQVFEDNAMHNMADATRRELHRISDLIVPGASIALAVGSRGIDNLQTVVKTVVEYLKSKNARPFIVPAMGSHGGATAEGQSQILAGYGITEAATGAQIRSSMDVVELPQGSLNHNVYMDKHAWEADGVILINKVKPHTDFHAAYESGLVKMAVIGLGKERGAEAIHHYGVQGLTTLIPQSAQQIFAQKKVLAGIALVENASDRTMMIKAIRADQIMEKEPELLDIARDHRPKLPVDNIDVLIIDEMGKDISGVGIDTNIIGRIRIYGQNEPDNPRIRSIIVRDITEGSHGNATGIGLADIITQKLYEKIDFEKTYKNIITSSFLERGKIPIVAENDLEALQLALRNAGSVAPGEERIVRIQNTLRLEEMYVSAAAIEALQENPNIEILERDVALFGHGTDICPFN
jgi:hypothetical protein